MTNTETIESARTDAASGALLALQSAAAGATVQKIERHPFIINPLTGRPVSLAEFLDKPLGIVETRGFADLESFVAYVTKFKGPGAIIVGEGSTLTALLDYHTGPNGPEASTHRAVFKLIQTEALQAWVQRNGKPMDQLAFVEFLEERAAEFTDPDPATLLEIAQDLHVVNGAAVSSCVRSGADIKVAFTKTEQVKASGDVVIPTKLLVNIQPFEDQPQRIETIARLRVRNREGTVTLGFTLENLPAQIRTASAEIAHAAGKAAGVEVYI